MILGPTGFHPLFNNTEIMEKCQTVLLVNHLFNHLLVHIFMFYLSVSLTLTITHIPEHAHEIGWYSS